MLAAAHALSREGFSLSILPCSSAGRYSAEALARMIRPDTALVSLQIANNETGVLQPIDVITSYSIHYTKLYETILFTAWMKA